jgi:glucosyl-3-phosphoglycerate synthase
MVGLSAKNPVCECHDDELQLLLSSQNLRKRMEGLRDTNRIIVFDLDNSLLQSRFIDVCAKEYNFSQALALLRQIDNDQDNLVKRTATFLKGKSREELVEITKNIPLADDVEKVVRELKSRSQIIGIITKGYQLVAASVAERIGADFYLANELKIDDDVVTGEVAIPLYFLNSARSKCKHRVCKTNALQYIANNYNIELQNCTIISNNQDDPCLSRHAGRHVNLGISNGLLTPLAEN